MLEAHVEAVPPGGAIDWATYYFRDDRLADALIRAHERGVSVRIVLEGAPRFRSANEAVIHRLAALGDGLRVLHHSLPIHLHEKIYCFSHPAPVALVGSFNPSGNGVANDPVTVSVGDQDRGHNDLVELTDAETVRLLTHHVRALHAGDHGFLADMLRSPHATVGAGDELQFFPTLQPNILRSRLEALRPGSRVRIAVSHLRDMSFAWCFAALAGRGVEVEVILNGTLRRAPAHIEAFLLDHGVVVRRYAHPDHLPMHGKFVLADAPHERWLMFGSYNLTRSSRLLNRELIVLSEDAGLWNAFDARWRDIVSEPGCRPAGRETTGNRLSIVMVDSHAAVERGGAVQCARLARALVVRGHRVTCVFDQPRSQMADGEEIARLRQAGVDVRRYRLNSLRAARRFRREVLSARPNIVHTHKNRALRFVYAAGLGGRRFAWVANRGTDYSLLPGSPVWAIHRYCVDRIVAVSEAVRTRLLRDGLPPEKVRVIYGSVDTNRFRPGLDGTAFRKQWQIAEDAPLIGMAASFRSRKKGQGIFLQAAARVLVRHPEARFVLIGEGSRARYEQLAERLGIADRVVFAGFVEDMPHALSAIDLVVCASVRGEGLTGVLREALAMARPVVSTDVAGNRELVRHEETGLLVPPGDAAALADAIEAMLGDREWAATMARAGRRWVLETSTDEVRARKVEQLYLAAARRIPARPSGGAAGG